MLRSNVDQALLRATDGPSDGGGRTPFSVDGGSHIRPVEFFRFLEITVCQKSWQVGLGALAL